MVGNDYNVRITDYNYLAYSIKVPELQLNALMLLLVQTIYLLRIQS